MLPLLDGPRPKNFASSPLMASMEKEECPVRFASRDLRAEVPNPRQCPPGSQLHILRQPKLTLVSFCSCSWDKTVWIVSYDVV